MPILNGKKMACVPCIRGHRSTKCNHGDDRILMEVRKPGRPLSNCPCRPGKPCACGAVKVAIPKKQKCGGCPPESQTQPASTSQDPSPIQTTQSPTASSFRVTKAAPPRGNGRKPSFDPSNLYRVDPSTVNLTSPVGIGLEAGSIATSMAMVSNGVAPVQPLNLTGYGTGVGSEVPNMAFSPLFNMGYGSHLPINMSLPYATNHHIPQHSIKMEDDLSSPYTGASNLDLGSPILSPPPPYTNGNAQPYTNGRHSRSSSSNSPEYLVGLGTTPMPHSTTSTDQTPGSCCGGDKEADNTAEANLSLYSKPIAQHYEPQRDTKRHNAHAPMDMSTVFTYPAQYGSWNLPINPQMWQQIASASQPSMAAPPMPATSNSTLPDLGISHECTCGPGCQCLGCLVHPFNDQTYQYVNSAYTEGNGINGHSTPSSPGSNGVNGVSGVNGVNGGGNGNGINGSGAINGAKRVNGINRINKPSDTDGTEVNGSHASNGTKPGSCCAPTATTAQTPTIPPESPKQAPESPPDARTPSEGSGLGEEQQTLSDLDYLWVAMPPREEDGCYGLMASCPCGDDCSCVGCSLHNP